MIANTGVFVSRDESMLVAMQPASFGLEDDFQRLLTMFPELFAGDQIDPEELLILREQAIASKEGGSGRWSINHLFLDQDGPPCSKSSNGLSIVIFSTPSETPTGSGTISAQIIKSSQWHYDKPSVRNGLLPAPADNAKSARTMCLDLFDDWTFFGEVRRSEKCQQAI